MNTATSRLVHRLFYAANRSSLTPLILLVLLVGLLSSRPVAGYDVCSDGGTGFVPEYGRCAHETMGWYGVKVYNAVISEGFLTDTEVDLIAEGAGHEDEFDHIYAYHDQSNATTVTHFWNPEVTCSFLGVNICDTLPPEIMVRDGFYYNPLNQTLLESIFASQHNPIPNNWQKAQAYWSLALGEYVRGNLDGSCVGKEEFIGCGAYHYLGHVVHHMGDNTIPTHAHNGEHSLFTGTDAFENWMSGKFWHVSKYDTPEQYQWYPAGYLLKAGELDALQKPIGGYQSESRGLDPLAAMVGTVPIPPGAIAGPVDTPMEKLYWLQYTTNQIADFFPSDRHDGDTLDFEGWVQSDLDRMDSFITSPIAKKHLENNNQTCAAPTLLDPESPCDNNLDGDLGEIRKYSYLRGIRAIAGLYELFQQTVSQPVVNVHIGRTTQINDCDDIDDQDDCDFYSRVRFHDFYTGKVLSDGRNEADEIKTVAQIHDVNWNWGYGIGHALQSNELITVSISLMDEDGGKNDGVVDIANGSRKDLWFAVNLSKCLSGEEGALSGGNLPANFQNAKCGVDLEPEVTFYEADQGLARITFRIDMNNLPPVAQAGGPYTVNEGGSVSLDGTGSSDPNEDDILTYDWDLDNDGIFEASGAFQTFAGHDGPDTQTVMLRVSDGTLTGADTATVNITNVAPTISNTLVLPTSMIEGQSVAVSGTFTDPALFYEITSGSALWSDGPTTPLTVGTGTFSTSRNFPDDHPATGTTADLFTVEITINDGDGGSDTETSQTVTINNVAPAITATNLSASTIVDGDSVTVSGTFIDPALGVATETFSGSALWSDGATTPLTAGTGTFSTSRNFPVDQPTAAYLVTADITINDDDGGSNTETSPILTIIVTPQSIINAVNQLDENGDIDRKIVKSLLKKLSNAMRKQSQGQCRPAGNMYGAFINEVQAQSGKSITPLAAGILIADAEYLIAHCQ